jgi:hypothetical protein
VSYAIVRVAQRSLDLDSFAQATSLHPDLIRRLIALGLLNPEPDATGQLRFDPDQVAACERIQRLRAGFALNYAALGLVIDLLDRIAVLEAAARQRCVPTAGPTWT